MAWNEPGNSGGKDPWGSGRKDEQGPPDLDEVVRKLQEKLTGIFGGGKKGSNGTGGGGTEGLGIGLGLIGVVMAVLWAASGLYIIDEGNRGVVLQFGKYNDTTMPGLHWYPRLIQTVEVVNVESVRTVELGTRTSDSLMLTEDENVISIRYVVQYQIGNARDYLFNVHDPEQTLHQVAESSMREIVGKTKMDFIMTGGLDEVIGRAKVQLQATLERYTTGINVSSVNIQDAQPPEQVQNAFADAIKAREDNQRIENEAKAYANDVLPRARGASARLLEEANAYKEQVIAQAEGETSRFLAVLAEYRKAPEVTRKRLYLDSMESVLTQSSKVVIDTEGGNNLLYLPLDKLMQRDNVSSVSTSNESLQSGSSSNRPRDNQRRREVR
ncbi:MAG: FtsH protease activity modulator HflK [Gammaproteobacteria bacterium]|nr:FtsH protease activity modulator HflK [Gammaproteobacteria bacterium]